MERSHATELEFTLAGIGIFAGLSSKALKALRETCSWQRYKPGEPVVDYLDASDEVFCVVMGEVCVTIYSLRQGRELS
jgi:CRP-like cAMP-binding protein